ncbi:MAG: restriction endonuclease subunit S [Muribaculaceae bacterium]|nr:restriction endonuclease subunit S [Muribaculaceae bacterium]
MLSKVKWGEFKIDDLFYIRNAKSFNSDKLVEGDDYDYVTRTSSNQGVLSTTGYVNSGNINQSGIWSLGLLQMDFYYRKKTWYAGQFVRKVVPKFEIIGDSHIFFTTLLNGLKLRLLSVLVRNVNSKFINSKIFLPITESGEIDFEFINAFSSELERVHIADLENYLKICQFDDYELTKVEKNALANIETNGIKWGDYKLGDLFDKIKTKKLPYKAKELPSEPNRDFILPCLTSSFRNQGLNYYVPKANATILKDVITIPSNSDVYRAYFQSNEFTVLSDAYAIRWKSATSKLSQNQYLFMVMCINKVTDLPIYSYKNKLGGWEVVKHKYIKLPQKGNDIDFEFMDNLINAIKKLNIIKLHHFLHKKTNSEIKSDYITSEREHSLAAEPFEVYGYSDFESVSNMSNKSHILVGCYKSPEHLQWILNYNKYNVRLGDRAGSMDEHKELFAKTSKLILYNMEEPTEIRVMEISDPKEITGKQINELGYPDKRPDNYRYEIFNTQPSYESGNQYSDLVKEIIFKPGHIEGAPIFITSKSE